MYLQRRRGLAGAAAAVATLVIAAFVVESCGGDQSLPVPPPGDFELQVSSKEIAVQSGATTVVSVSVKPSQGFRDSVAITVDGTPAGTTTDPAAPFFVAAGGTREFAVQVPFSADAKAYPLTIRGVSAPTRITRSTTATLNVSPGADFTLTATPATVLLRPNGESMVTLSVNPRNGFSDTIIVSFSVASPGVSITPTGPLIAAPGTSLQIHVAAQPGIPTGSYPVTIVGTAKTRSATASLALSVIPPVYTFRSDSLLILDRVEGGDSLRVAVNLSKGGAIVAADLNGKSFINAADHSRGGQVSLSDGNGHYDCDGCGVGFNPTQAADRYGHASPILATEIGSDYVYVKTQLNQWYPDNKNGGPSQPALTDVVLEQWVRAVPTEPRAIRVQYRLTHLGSDEHLTGGAWLPAVATPVLFKRVMRYVGNSPWANGQLTVGDPSGGLPPSRVESNEAWAALADSKNVGLTVYAPGSYPFLRASNQPGTDGPAGSGFNRIGTFAELHMAPGSTLNASIYMIVGEITSARETIYRLHTAAPFPDYSEPIGFIDVPGPEVEMTGVTRTRGWAVDNVGVTNIDVFVDGRLVGNAAYGQPRPDLLTAFPGVTANGGWEFQFDSRTIADGLHDFWVNFRDAAGNALIPHVRRITINNQGQGRLPDVDVMVGTPERVLEGAAVKCSPNDLFDLRPRAVRAPNGTVVVSVPHFENYLNYGTSLNDLRHDCHNALPSPNNPRPENGDNLYWLHTLYRVGDTIHALVHKEYHDRVAPRCTSGAVVCAWDGIVYAYSVDNGRNFQTPAPPTHVIAAPRVPWDPTYPNVLLTYSNPSNIVRGPGDGYYYAMFAAIPDPTDTRGGACLMRTKVISDPASWRAWDGADFTLRVGSPYQGSAADRPCAFISRDQIFNNDESLTYNAYLGAYILVGYSTGPSDHCGFGYALSKDLIHWSSMRLFFVTPLDFCFDTSPGVFPGKTQYPALIDPNAPDVNFEITGRTGYVYYVRFPSNRNDDRDLMRVPVTFVIK